MKLYVIRHATAHDVGEKGILTDEARTLNHTGEKEADQLGAYLKSKSVHLEVLAHSPLVRARQTAERISKHLHCELREVEKLSTEHDVEAHLEALDMFKFMNSVGIVGHQPTLSKFILTLMGASPRAGLKFTKCALAVLNLERLGSTWTGQLVTLLSPADL
ncbi:MAG: phosphohistidine phosphatase SixA [Chloroherpetonaceae bacterium]|nr:phosphohistidine phosphatase SixA [Chloroherpetonaceae bacterium]MCS7211218.1 phosphohistidine phosphatase SixA [Chloroherpetonaceae bacterium]MDW8019967.1 phosphohistidine phosphatase SixA [Chloroherpetonaceae bacterium]